MPTNEGRVPGCRAGGERKFLFAVSYASVTRRSGRESIRRCRSSRLFRGSSSFPFFTRAPWCALLEGSIFGRRRPSPGFQGGPCPRRFQGEGRMRGWNRASSRRRAWVANPPESISLPPREGAAGDRTTAVLCPGLLGFGPSLGIILDELHAVGPGGDVEGEEGKGGPSHSSSSGSHSPPWRALGMRGPEKAPGHGGGMRK